ncbi:MAG: 6-phosphofructokinase [Candidatus Omnitrophota bacterium]
MNWVTTKKVISYILILTFLLTNSLYAAPSERSFFKNRKVDYEKLSAENEEQLDQKRTLLTGGEKVPKERSKKTAQIDLVAHLKDLSQIHIPKELGRVIEVYEAIGVSKKKDKFIVHIQDLHANPEAELNLANILEILIKDYDLDLVCSEGAEGEVDTSSVSSFPDTEIREKTAKLFIDSGELTGEEYLSITKYPDLPIWGIEDKEIYFENILQFNKIMEFSPSSQVFISKCRNALEALKPKIYSREILELDKKEADYELGELETAEYLEYILPYIQKLNILAADYKNIILLTETMEQEKNIDQSEIMKESQGLLNELQTVILEKRSSTEIEALIAKAELFKQKKISPFSFYSYLKSLALTHLEEGKLSEYSHLNGFIDYLTKVNSLDSVKLFNEIENLSYEIKQTLSKTSEEKVLTKAFRNIKFLAGFFNLKISNEELNYYLSDKDSCKVEFFAGFIKPNLKRYNINIQIDFDPRSIDAKLEELEEFYSTVKVRDTSMFNNALAEIKKRNSKVTAFISGGFHTEGVTRMLREQNYSYVVISPYSSQETDEENYKFLLSGKRKPIEELIKQLDDTLRVPLKYNKLSEEFIGRQDPEEDKEPAITNPFSLFAEGADRGDITIDDKTIIVGSGGGDCAGLNDLIADLVIESNKKGYKVLGIKNSFDGMLDGNYEEKLVELTPEIAESMRGLPSTVLGSCRREISGEKNAADLKEIIKRFKGAKAIVITGGNDHTKEAKAISDASREQGEPIQVIGVPKSIDDDFHTAMLGFVSAYLRGQKIAARASIDPETTHNVAAVFEVMGRNSGSLTYECSKGSPYPKAVIVPEIEVTIDGIINAAKEGGIRNFFVSEGFSLSPDDPKLEELLLAYPTLKARHEQSINNPILDVDAHGHPRLTGASLFVVGILEHFCGLKVERTDLTYQLRGASPQRDISGEEAFDTMLARLFAKEAVSLISEGKTGLTVTYEDYEKRDGDVLALPADVVYKSRNLSNTIVNEGGSLNNPTVNLSNTIVNEDGSLSSPTIDAAFEAAGVLGMPNPDFSPSDTKIYITEGSKIEYARKLFYSIAISTYTHRYASCTEFRESSDMILKACGKVQDGLEDFPKDLKTVVEATRESVLVLIPEKHVSFSEISKRVKDVHDRLEYANVAISKDFTLDKNDKLLQEVLKGDAKLQKKFEEEAIDLGNGLVRFESGVSRFIIGLYNKLGFKTRLTDIGYGLAGLTEEPYPQDLLKDEEYLISQGVITKAEGTQQKGLVLKPMDNLKNLITDDIERVRELTLEQPSLYIPALIDLIQLPVLNLLKDIVSQDESLVVYIADKMSEAGPGRKKQFEPILIDWHQHLAANGEENSYPVRLIESTIKNPGAWEPFFASVSGDSKRGAAIIQRTKDVFDKAEKGDLGYATTIISGENLRDVSDKKKIDITELDDESRKELMEPRKSRHHFTPEKPVPKLCTLLGGAGTRYQNSLQEEKDFAQQLKSQIKGYEKGFEKFMNDFKAALPVGNVPILELQLGNDNEAAAKGIVVMSAANNSKDAGVFLETVLKHRGIQDPNISLFVQPVVPKRTPTRKALEAFFEKEGVPNGIDKETVLSYCDMHAGEIALDDEGRPFLAAENHWDAIKYFMQQGIFLDLFKEAMVEGGLRDVFVRFYNQDNLGAALGEDRPAQAAINTLVDRVQGENGLYEFLDKIDAMDDDTWEGYKNSLEYRQELQTKVGAVIEGGLTPGYSSTGGGVFDMEHPSGHSTTGVFERANIVGDTPETNITNSNTLNISLFGLAAMIGLRPKDVSEMIETRENKGSLSDDQKAQLVKGVQEVEANNVPIRQQVKISGSRPVQGTERDIHGPIGRAFDAILFIGESMETYKHKMTEMDKKLIKGEIDFNEHQEFELDIAKDLTFVPNKQFDEWRDGKRPGLALSKVLGYREESPVRAPSKIRAQLEAPTPEAFLVALRNEGYYLMSTEQLLQAAIDGNQEAYLEIKDMPASQLMAYFEERLPETTKDLPEDLFGFGFGYDIRGNAQQIKGGIVNMTPENFYLIGKLLGSQYAEVGDNVLVTGDGRYHAPILRYCLVLGYASAGVNAEFSEEVLTTGAHNVFSAENTGKYKHQVQISGSHGVPQKNGIKIKVDFGKGFLDPLYGKKLGDLYKNRDNIREGDYKLGRIDEIEGIQETVVEMYDKTIPQFTKNEILVIDSRAGAGGPFAEKFFSKRDFTIVDMDKIDEQDIDIADYVAGLWKKGDRNIAIMLNMYPDPGMGRGIWDPSKPEALVEAKGLINKLNTIRIEGMPKAIAAVFDGDADRVTVIRENGDPVPSFEMTLPFYQRFLLDPKNKSAIINMVNTGGEPIWLACDVRSNNKLSDLLDNINSMYQQETGLKDRDFIKGYMINTGYPSHLGFIEWRIGEMDAFVDSHTDELSGDPDFIKNYDNLKRTYFTAEASGHNFSQLAPSNPYRPCDDGLGAFGVLINLRETIGDIEAPALGMEKKEDYEFTELFEQFPVVFSSREIRVPVPNNIKISTAKKIGAWLEKTYGAELRPNEDEEPMQLGGLLLQPKEDGFITVAGFKAQFKDGRSALVRWSNTGEELTLIFTGYDWNSCIVITQEVTDRLKQEGVNVANLEKEIEQLKLNNNIEAKRERVSSGDLNTKIKFGTSGWRAGDNEFTVGNVSRTAQAIAETMIDETGKPAPEIRIAVSYDARLGARNNAMRVVEVLAGNGIHADFIDQLTPTPVMVESTRGELPEGERYDLAVHITASHNPVYRSEGVTWQGMKILANGIVAGDDFTSKIAKRANDKSKNNTYMRIPLEQIPETKTTHNVDLLARSNARLRKAFDFERLKENIAKYKENHPGFDIEIDVMHGAAIEASRIFSELGVEVQYYNTTPIYKVIDEGTLSLADWQPDPTKLEFLDKDFSLKPEWDEKIGLAFDGDGDRLIINDIDGRVLGPKDLGLIFVHYLYHEKGVRGVIVRTLATSRSVDRFAKTVGLVLKETPIGSKHFAPYAVHGSEEKLLVGIEEDSHLFFKINGEIFADSAIGEALLAIEILTTTGKSLEEYLADIQKEQQASQELQPLFYNRGVVDVEVVNEKFKQNILKLRVEQPEVFAEIIAERLSKNLLLDGNGGIIDGVAYDTADKDGILVRFDDDTWCMYRVSGTSDSVRIYGEERTPELLQDQQRVVQETLIELAESVSINEPDLTGTGEAAIKERLMKQYRSRGLLLFSSAQKYAEEFDITFIQAEQEIALLKLFYDSGFSYRMYEEHGGTGTKEFLFTTDGIVTAPYFKFLRDEFSELNILGKAGKIGLKMEQAFTVSGEERFTHKLFISNAFMDMDSDLKSRLINELDREVSAKRKRSSETDKSYAKRNVISEPQAKEELEFLYAVYDFTSKAMIQPMLKIETDGNISTTTGNLDKLTVSLGNILGGLRNIGFELKEDLKISYDSSSPEEKIVNALSFKEDWTVDASDIAELNRQFKELGVWKKAGETNLGLSLPGGYTVPHSRLTRDPKFAARMIVNAFAKPIFAPRNLTVANRLMGGLNTIQKQEKISPEDYAVKHFKTLSEQDINQAEREIEFLMAFHEFTTLPLFEKALKSPSGVHFRKDGTITTTEIAKTESAGVSRRQSVDSRDKIYGIPASSLQNVSEAEFRTFIDNNVPKDSAVVIIAINQTEYDNVEKFKDIAWIKIVPAEDAERIAESLIVFEGENIFNSFNASVLDDVRDAQLIAALEGAA